jgi:hypothetical protein
LKELSGSLIEAMKARAQLLRVDLGVPELAVPRLTLAG